MRRRRLSLLQSSFPAILSIVAGAACDREITGNADRTDASIETQAAVVSSASPTTPHFTHMRAGIIDYRIHYLKEPQKSAEYNWTAARFDRVIGGTLYEYKKRNPTIRQYVYDYLWFAPVAYAGPAEAWLANNGYNVERAYLHKAGTSRTKANRIKRQQYAGRDYWYYNLGDPGYRAYRAAKANQLSVLSSAGHRAEAYFFDSNSNSTIKKYVPAVTLEYTSGTAYFADLYSLLTAQRNAVPAGVNLLNQAQHFTKPDEMATAAIAGGVMTEYGNTPYGRPRWAEVDKLVANGVTVHMSTGVSPGSKNAQRADMTAGNYKSIRERVLMWEYGSYLMVADPNRMDAVVFEPYGLNWSKPFSVAWLPAYEIDIGLALAKRSVVKSGKDPAGQFYYVLKREFANNALVLIRGQGGTQYGNHTGVTVALPGSGWRMLRADGTLTGVVTSVKLRNSEALVFRR
jgi:hypothetical protein